MTQNYRGIEELGGIRHQHRVVVVDKIDGSHVIIKRGELCLEYFLGGRPRVTRAVGVAVEIVDCN